MLHFDFLPIPDDANVAVDVVQPDLPLFIERIGWRNSSRASVAKTLAMATVARNKRKT
jgi:hypothetical protein